MNNKDTGGPAFPSTMRWVGGDNYEPLTEGGMTLRDWFAGQVAVGLMTEYWNSDRLKDPLFSEIAKESYALADQMLKARQ